MRCSSSRRWNEGILIAASINGSIAGGITDTTYSLPFLGNQLYAGTLTATKVPEPASGLGVAAGATLAVLARWRRRAGAV